MTICRKKKVCIVVCAILINALLFAAVVEVSARLKRRLKPEKQSTAADYAALQSYRDFALIFTYIDKGLGDFYWTLNIYRAVLEARKDSPICVVAYLKDDANIGSVRSEHTYFAFRDAASVYDVVLEHSVFYVLQGKSADSAAFDRINALARAVSVCICFDTCSRFFRNVDAAKVFEYDYAHTAILFRDYSSVPREREYRKTHLSPEEYRRTLAEDVQARFDTAKIALLVPDSEYVFCYFHSSGIFPPSIFHLLMLVSDVARLDSHNGETVAVLCNFDVQRMLQWIRQRAGSIAVDLHRGTMRINNRSPVFRFVCYGHVSEPEFEYMLLRSGEVAGCTGDMSVSQVLSTGRIMSYQCLGHKEGVFRRLVEIWGEVNGNRNLRMLSDTTRGFLRTENVLPENFDMWRFRSQYRDFLVRLRKNDFSSILQRAVRERARR